MKKILRIAIVTMVYIGAVQAQNEDLEFEIDSNGVITSSRYLEAVDRQGEIVFDLSGSGTEDGTELNGIYVQIYGSGQCNGGNALVFITNKERLTLRSTSKMNCKGLSYFDLDEDAKRILMNYRISRIIFYNGRNRDPRDNVKRGRVQVKDMFYFIELFYAIDNEVFSNRR